MILASFALNWDKRELWEILGKLFFALKDLEKSFIAL